MHTTRHMRVSSAGVHDVISNAAVVDPQPENENARHRFGSFSRPKSRFIGR